MAGRINSSARHSFGLDFNRFAAMSLVLANSKQVKTDQQQLFCQYIGCYKKRALDTASLNYVSIKQPWYHCDKCEKKYANHPDLKAHIAVAHNSKEVKMFACEWPGCQYSSKQKQNVQFHYLTVHKKEKPYKCHYPGCNKEYSAHHHLLVHQNKVPQISCPFPGCKKTFGSKNSLRKHQKSRGKKRPVNRCMLLLVWVTDKYYIFVAETALPY
ncbi:unnamed protein product [Mucor fragilis]